MVKLSHFALLGTVSLPIISALVTYTFVSLPDASISLDTRGTLVLMVVMLEFFLIGATGVFPIDLNKLWKMRGKRKTDKRGYVDFTRSFPCFIRVLCELETSIKTFDYEEMNNEDISRSKNKNASISRLLEETFDESFLERDLLEDYQRAAVSALYLNESLSNHALFRLSSLTGEMFCGKAYQRCGGKLSPMDAIKALFKEIGLSQTK